MPADDPAAGLVLDACAAAVGGARPGAVAPTDLTREAWDRALSLADRHRVVPVFGAFVESTGPGAVPDAISSRLRAERRTVTRRNLALAAALGRVVDRFEAAGVRALAYKGPVIAERLYGGLDRRQFLDLDVLVDPADVETAHGVLEAEGYAARKRLPGLEQVVYADDAGVVVDLHAAVTPRYFPGELPFEALWRRRTPATVGDRTVPTLGAADLLAVLCVHGTKHRWHRLSWIADVAALLAAEDVDWAQVEADARRLRARRMIALGAAVTENVLGVDTARRASALADTDGAVAALVDRTRELLFADGSSGPGPHLRYHARALERPVDRLAYAWRLATTPTAAEFDLVDLPEPLAPLYAVIRPPRLLGAYLARRVGRRFG